MLIKGIIEQVIDEYTVKVRIPSWDGPANSSEGVPTESLSIATVCSPAGLRQVFQPGEVVFVEQEQDDKNAPVVMGVLERASTESSSEITARAITAEISVTMPETFFDILDNYYKPQFEQMQAQIDALQAQINSK